MDLKQHKNGVLLPIKVVANARRSELRGIQDGVLKVSVTATPEKGKANAAIVKLVAKSLGLRKSQVEIQSGHTNSSKALLVSYISISELLQRIENSVDPKS